MRLFDAVLADKATLPGNKHLYFISFSAAERTLV
jgi:hypothetical protein